MLILKLIPGLQDIAGPQVTHFLNLCGAFFSPGTGQLTKLLGTLVVDELHLVGDASRGYLLEIFLSKAGCWCCWLQGITFLHVRFETTCACFFCCNLRDLRDFIFRQISGKKKGTVVAQQCSTDFFLWFAIAETFFLTLFTWPAMANQKTIVSWPLQVLFLAPEIQAACLDFSWQKHCSSSTPFSVDESS